MEITQTKDLNREIVKQSPDFFIMDTTLDKEENSKNIYVIRRKLSTLKRSSRSHFEYKIGIFTLNIFTHNNSSEPTDSPNLLDYEKVYVLLNETSKSGIVSTVSIRDDNRFKNYKPIQYNVIETPNGTINLSDGDNMPIVHLCELISYLHRLSNLTAFM